MPASATDTSTNDGTNDSMTDGSTTDGTTGCSSMADANASAMGLSANAHCHTTKAAFHTLGQQCSMIITLITSSLGQFFVRFFSLFREQ
jgi:hypothetical protein